MSQLSNAITTTLQSTYYDDYNESKQYYRILFRPAVSVQARELTQLQTAIQKQISRFGDNIFRDGSIVDGCAVNDYANTRFVRLVDSLLTGNVAITDLAAGKYIITNGTTANSVRATVLTAQTGFVSTYPNTNQLYLNYYYTGKDGSNNDVSTFANGETLYIYNANQTSLGALNGSYLAATINVYTSNSSTTSIGKGYCLGISEGIVYHKGFFQSVNRQVTVVKRHDSSPNNYVVGFETEESIVTDAQDSSLFDNAQGFTNFNAPGAHRLKLNPVLVPYSKDAVSNTFFAIAEFDGGKLNISRKADQSYNKINEVMSQRTFEESGNYTVRPFVVQTSTVAANTNAFFYQLSPGLAYVKGSRVELIGAYNKQVSRANTTAIDQNQTITANYGNYVYVNETIGAPDLNTMGEVAIYDVPQYTVSGVKGSSGAMLGNIVGYANIKSLLYYSGTKGLPSCQYYLYLFNIRMNPGKSFSADAKSFYKSTSPRFKADIVLENTKAVLKDSTFTSLVFNSGVPAVKTLTPSGGSVDTTFTYRKTSTTTLNGNGTFTTTLSGGLGTGGTEQLFSTNARDYMITFTQNSYSSNITGTISTNSTASSSNAVLDTIIRTTVTGVGTLFQTQLKAGDLIRFSNTTGSNTAVVNSVISNTSLTLVANAPQSFISGNIQRYYPDGSVLDVQDSMLTVNPGTNTFTITTGTTFTFGSGNTMYVQYPVQRTLAAPIGKAVKKNRYVKIDCSNNAGGIKGPWSLGLPDVYKIEKIHVGTSYSNTTTDVKSWFSFDTGQRDDLYGHAKITVKSSKASQITSSSKILVELDHFEANTSVGAGFFSIDSYPISSDGISSNSSTIPLAEVPFFTTSTGERLNLRDSIDFRPISAATANSVANTNFANTLITVNPPAANSNTFSVGAYGQYLPEADSTFQADYEYYLPRRDLIVATPSGNFTVIEGNPELNPRLPLNITDGSVVAESIVPPFPSLTTSEAEAYNRNDISISIVLRSNKRYTMEEIGVLDDRVKRLEYYTVLNAVEQAARSLTIPKEDGTDRFKNGIFAEPFISHESGAVYDPAYAIATYSSESSMRPKFVENALDFQYVPGSSTNVVKSGFGLMLPYTSEVWASQSSASKYRVLTESIWQWNGMVDLLPETDYFKDTRNAPAVNFTVDLAQPFRDNANALFGTDYQTLSTVVDTDVTTATNRARTGGGTTTTTTITTTDTTTTKTLATTTSFGGTTTTTSTVGSFVQDVSIVPYIREQYVSFMSTSLKPNTKLHCFFDKINVDLYVAPGTAAAAKTTAATFETKPNYFVTPTAPLGTQLVANSTGGVAGIFKIPDNVFRTGERDFLITNVDDLDQGANAQITKAQATFTASSLSVTKAPLTMTTINPKILVSSEIITTTDVDVTVDTNSTFRPNPPVVVPPSRVPVNPGRTNRQDPIAQSFLAAAPEGAEGMFLTQVGVYFKQKDPALGITVYISEMSSGLPDGLNIIGQGFLPTSSINVSDDASLETVFTLDMPVYMENNREYAFIVEPQGNSPEPLIWLAETGGIDVATGQNIFKDTYSGVAFVSANKSTWTPVQKEDVKFNLYRAKFTALSGTASFRNESDEYLTVTGLTRISSSVGIKVGDVVYSQNSTTNTALTSASFPFGVVQDYNESDGTIILDSARQGFSSTVNPRIEFHRILPVSNTSVSNSTIIAFANVVSVDNKEYHAIVPKFASIVPAGTSVDYSYKGTDLTYNVDSSYSTVRVERPNELTSKAKMAVSRTNENNFVANNKTTFLQAALTSTNEYMSPVLDLRRKGAILVKNIINDDVTGEDTNNGNALCRYISKTITLAEGQDAEDIKIFLRAYRPTGTNLHVYGKFQSKEDAEPFDSKKWTKLNYLNATDDIYSSSAALEWKEYEFGFANTPNTTVSFSANTGVNSAGDYILVTNNPFVNNNLVLYYKLGSDVDDPVLAGLTNSTFYYVVSSNSTALQLSSAQDGAALAINASANATALHYMRSYLPTVSGTSYLNPDNSNIVEYYNTAGSRFESYKYFAIKIVLTSTTGIKVPKLDDMRAIALQV